MSIIFGLGDYDDQCERAQLTTLDIRREDLCLRFFFRKVLNPGDCLNYLSVMLTRPVTSRPRPRPRPRPNFLDLRPGTNITGLNLVGHETYGPY